MYEYESPLLPAEFLKKYENKIVPWGFNNLGYIVYKRTYARIKDDNTTEEWWETVARCINGAQKIGAGYNKEEAQRLFDHIFHLRCNFAGRMLWQLGTSTIDRFGANSLLNCWGVTIREPEDFCFVFENLMLGGGVGFSIRREDIHELPKIKKDVSIFHEHKKDADFIVPDKREGWVSLLQKVLDSFFITGKSFTYSTILVRGAGEPIKGFGGKASGPGALIEGMTNISGICNAREGKKLRSLDVLDICNIIGSIVVSGNVRRSAMIALGDPDDYLFLKAKRWDTGDIPNWRAMSNNTIYADDFSHISPLVWEGYQGNGEPYGFFNLPLSQQYGRLGDKIKDNAEVTNPCSEITLASYESCNLSELYLNNITSKKELIDCAKLLFKAQKAICAMNFIHEKTNKIVHKNMRIGVGVTGICQSPDKIEWLDDCYNALRKFDKTWSKQRGHNQSIKITTIKPSGTLSLLAGATPGIHPGFSQYYMRTVRMSSTDSLVETCRDMGYKIEYAIGFDGVEDHSTVVVYFPCTVDNATLAKDMTAVNQLELVKKMQRVWADNAISVTVYYKKEELPDIQEWLNKNFNDNIKAVSFLLHKEHGFKQAPYIEIDETEYNDTLSRIKPLLNNNSIGNDIESMECENGTCPIK